MVSWEKTFIKIVKQITKGGADIARQHLRSLSVAATEYLELDNV